MKDEEKTDAGTRRRRDTGISGVRLSFLRVTPSHRLRVTSSSPLVDQHKADRNDNGRGNRCISTGYEVVTHDAQA